MNFFLDPLYSMVTRDQTKKFPKTQITVPFVVIYAISLFFVLMSYVFGKWFKMPYWAFTPMETYKVNIAILILNDLMTLIELIGKLKIKFSNFS